ncbi:MAG: DUF1653 domain-containing protein [Clostridiaceae bacterium]
MQREIKKGSLYRHYKNKWYFVLDKSINSETREEYITYFPLYQTPIMLFVRPSSMFLDEIEEDKQLYQKERFLESDKIQMDEKERTSLLKTAKSLLNEIGLDLNLEDKLK